MDGSRQGVKPSLHSVSRHRPPRASHSAGAITPQKSPSVDRLPNTLRGTASRSSWRVTFRVSLALVRPENGGEQAKTEEAIGKPQITVVPRVARKGSYSLVFLESLLKNPSLSAIQFLQSFWHFRASLRETISLATVAVPALFSSYSRSLTTWLGPR